MSGTPSSLARSAYVAETVPGTIPSTPGFTTLHQPANMTAIPQIVEGRSRTAKGARKGHGYTGIDVTGTLESPLIYGVYDDFLATLLQGSWASDVLKDGKAEKTVAVETTLPAGLGGTATMLRFRGVEAMSGTLNLTARAAAVLSLQLIGRGSDNGTTTGITGATYTDPTEADPLTSGEDVGTITMAGYTLDCMQSLEMSFAFENRDPQTKVSSNDYCGITRGDFLPVLTANMYVETNFLAMYNAARGRHATFALNVPLGSVTGEKYTMLFPSCRFGSAEIDQSGKDIMQKVPILPEYNTSEGAVVKITRGVT